MLTYDLSKRGKSTMYEYLYEQMKKDILTGRLQAGEKLPSKRALSEHLQISIKTVENAYAQLLVEGYICSEEKRGYFVNRLTGGLQQQGPGYEPFVTKYKEETYIADLTANNINYEKFPFSVWAKVMRETITDYDTSLLRTVPFNGVQELRVEIAEYLYRSRGMQVSPDHIIVGAGTEYLYNRLIQLLGEDALYGVENPGYQKISKIFDAYHMDWSYTDVDIYGMNVEALREQNINVLHVSPGHQYPMGLVMPVWRRQELLEWAYERPDRYIVEDDFDCEFRMTGRPIPSLQSMDRNHRVIYMNNFSKTMVPSIRISYMVLPEKLMERYLSTMNFYSCTVSGFEQYALASFIRKGYFERHIRRMITFYRQQKELFLQMLRESPLMEIAEISEADAGTHFLLQVQTQLSDIELKWAAKERGILINCLSEYCFDHHDKYKNILIINYSDLDEKKMKQALRVLEEILV